MKVREYLNKDNYLKIVLSVYILSALITTLQSILSGPGGIHAYLVEYCSYNNYIIFKQSFAHLRNFQDLYDYYPAEHWDLFKYTPTFAAFFGLFAILPDYLGLFLWNLLNVLVLFFSIMSLAKLTKHQKLLMLIIAFVELYTSIQNEQSNAIMAGLIIFSFSMLEKRNYLVATLLIVASVYIKLFGIVAILLFLFYPGKVKLGLYTLMWSLILFIIPLLFIDLNQYLLLFKSYLNMLAHDNSVSYGYSLFGWLYTWFGFLANKYLLVFIGSLLLCLPLINIKSYGSYYYRLLMLSSVLIWVVIFNHKAESPTFVIAMAGASIWFVSSKKSIINDILLILAIFFTSLSPTDLIPVIFRENIAIPYSLKVFPMILIWIKINIDMFLKSKLISKA